MLQLPAHLHTKGLHRGPRGREGWGGGGGESVARLQETRPGNRTKAPMQLDGSNWINCLVRGAFSWKVDSLAL